MTQARLLPHNASRLERDVADALGDLGDIPTPLRTLWDSQSIPAELLPYLAWALSVEEEWEYADTEQERRDLVASSVALHRHKGTPYAVRQGLESAGFAKAKIREGEATLRHDGSFQRNGLEDYNAGRRWALFSVTLDLGNTKGFSGDSAGRARKAISTWKNARSHLQRIALEVSITESRDTDASASPCLGVHLAMQDYREGIRDGTLPRAAPTHRRHDGAWQYGAEIQHTGRTTWEGLRFGGPRAQHALGIHFDLHAARKPGPPRDGSIRFDADFSRDYRGAIDPAPTMKRSTASDARRPWPVIPGFLIDPIDGAWDDGRALDGPVYGSAVRKHPRDGQLLRSGEHDYGPDELTYYTQQGHTVFQTVWDYDQTQWDYDTTEWDDQ